MIHAKLGILLLMLVLWLFLWSLLLLLPLRLLVAMCFALACVAFEPCLALPAAVQQQPHGRLGQPVQPRAEPLHGDNVQVLRARVIRAVHRRPHRQPRRHAELLASRRAASNRHCECR